MTSKAFSRFDDGASREPAPTRSPTMCCVNGCPLPGPFRLSNDSSICQVHYGQQATAWADITTRIRNRLPLFELARKLTNDAPGAAVPEYALAELRQFGVSEIPAELNTARKAGSWLEGRLILKCAPGLKAPDVVGELGLKKAVEFLGDELRKAA